MALYKSITMCDGSSFTEVDKGIINRVTAFYQKDRKYVDCLLDILNGKAPVSIRVIDYFVTNYSKKYDTVYRIKVNGRVCEFNVYQEYWNQLSGYSKSNLDPFCRKKKVIYAYTSDDGTYSVTFRSSLGQLYFFYWAIRNKVLEYVNRHLKEIDDDMKATTKANSEMRKKLKEMVEEPEDSEDSSSSDDDFIDSSESIKYNFIPATTKSAPKPRKRQQTARSVYDRGVKISKGAFDIILE